MDVDVDGVTRRINLDARIAEASAHLQKIFRDCYKNKTKKDWVDGPATAKEFISKLGKQVYDKSQKIQKKYLEDGIVKNWDISLITRLLEDLLPPSKKNTYKTHLDNLKLIRNSLAHLSSPMLTVNDENGFTNDLVNCLTGLDMNQAEVQRIREIDHKKELDLARLADSRPKSPMFKAAEDEILQLIAQGKFTEAESKANESILNLTEAIEKSAIYEHLAEMFLKQYDDKKEAELLIDAHVNAEAAIQLNPLSPTGYRIRAEVCERQEELPEALSYFKLALMHHPTNGYLQAKIGNIKNQIVTSKSTLDLDPNAKVKTIDQEKQEYLNGLKSKGINMTMEQLHQINMEQWKQIPGMEQEMKAEEYLRGTATIKPNLKKAVELYEEAVNLNNTGAMFDLAFVYIRNPELKKSIADAMALLERAARMPLTMQLFNQTVPRNGVVEAQYNLGMLYDRGTRIPRNLDKAIEWYTMASQNGSAEASCDLGNIYASQERWDFDKAEKAYKFGISKGNTGSRANLVGLYLKVGDHENALKQHSAGLQDQNPKSIQDHNFVMQTINKIKDGTFKPPHTRLKQAKEVYDFVKGVDKLIAPIVDASSNIGEKLQPHFKYLEKCEKEGSGMAKILLESGRLFAESVKHYEKGNQGESIICFGKALCVSELPIAMTPDRAMTISAWVNKVLAVEKDNKSELDRYARVANFWVIMSIGKGPQVSEKFMKESIAKYPDFCPFYYLRGTSLGFLERYEEAIEMFTKAMQLDPNDYEYEYSLAGVLRLSQQNGNPEKAITHYKKFIEAAPKDHRLVPESYYCIATCYLDLMLKKKDKAIAEQVKLYYIKGLESQRDQLSIPFENEANAKFMVEFYLKKIYPEHELKPKPQKTTNEGEVGLDTGRVFVLKNNANFCKQLFSLGDDKPSFDVSFDTGTAKLSGKSLIGLKEITLGEMDASKDKVATGFVLSVTCVGYICYGSIPSVDFLVQDTNKQVERISVYNISKGFGDIKEKFAFGTKYLILNPYYKLGAADGIPTLRCDSPSSHLIEDGFDDNLCAVCGEVGNAKILCPGCKRFRFCSERCQNYCQTELHHKKLCKFLK